MQITPGRYRHYKGPEYRVFALAQHSETEEYMVFYQALYGDFGLWVRPLSMFTETVEVDGHGGKLPLGELFGVGRLGQQQKLADFRVWPEADFPRTHTLFSCSSSSSNEAASVWGLSCAGVPSTTIGCTSSANRITLSSSSRDFCLTGHSRSIRIFRA